MARAVLRRGVNLLGGGVGMADADGDAAPGQPPNEIKRAFLFGGEGDHAHNAFAFTRTAPPVFLARQLEIFLELRACLAFRQERRFHVRAQHNGAVGLGIVHHGFDAAQGFQRILRACAHGGGQERRHAEFLKFAAHVAYSGLAVHGIHAHKGMDVNVHKTGKKHVALKVERFLALGGQPLSDGGDFAILNPNVGSLREFPVDKGFCVFDDHRYLPFVPQLILLILKRGIDFLKDGFGRADLLDELGAVEQLAGHVNHGIFKKLSA